MPSRKPQIILAALLALVTMAGAAAPAGASSVDDDFIHPPGADKVLEVAVEPLATVVLDNGDTITFAPLHAEDGAVESVVVTGVRSPDRTPTRLVKGLEGADPLELFVALAPRGMAVPGELNRLYGTQRSERPQGWARDLVIDTEPQGVFCPANYWQDQLEHYADVFNDSPFVSAWNGPSTQPQDWASYAPGDGTIAHRLFGQTHDVTSFYGSVLYCVEDFENGTVFSDDEVGVYVYSYYRLAGTGTWLLSGGTEMTEVGDLYEHIYVGSSSPGAPAYDFRIRISLAKELDQFHIGASWVDGPPSDFKPGH